MVGLGGLISTAKGKDGVVDGIGDRIGDGAGVTMELPGSDGWMVAIGKVASPTTPLLTGARVDWGIVASSSLASEAYTGLGVTIQAFFTMTFLGFPVAALFWLISFSFSVKTSYPHEPKNRTG